MQLNANVTATFDEAMDPLTIIGSNFILTQGASTIAAGVSYGGTVATLNPSADLLPNTSYTATVTSGVTDLAANALAVPYTWTFQTGTGVALGPAPVNLGTAGNYVILSESGISTVPTSVVTGNIGVSPIASTAITGFSLMLDPSGQFSTSTQIVGKAYGASYASPTPANLTVAIGNMGTAYTDAAGRPLPDFVALGAGELGGLTLVPGLYNWSTGVQISTDVTLAGGPSDVWILQIAGGITESANIQVHLSGGALPKNVFWQTAGVVVMNQGAHMEGVVLAASQITLATGATVNGRLFSQTAVTLAGSTVTQPLP